MFNCIIVDDHSESIDILKFHLKQIPEIAVKNTFTNPIEALKYLDENKADLLFLDVEMPNFSGLDFLDNLKAKYGVQIPKIIFTTGHHQYAVTGYDKGVADYLLKPVSLSRLKLAVDRLLPVLKQQADTGTANTFFFVESDNKKVRIDFADILYVEAAGNYVHIATREKKYMIHETLTSIAGSLPEKAFVRTHKSFVAAIAGIRSVAATELVVGWEKTTKNIPIGATYKEAVFAKLGIS